MGVRGDSYGVCVLHTLSTFAYGPEKESAISVHLTAGGRGFGHFPEGLRLLVHGTAMPKLAAHSLRTWWLRTFSAPHNTLLCQKRGQEHKKRRKNREGKAEERRKDGGREGAKGRRGSVWRTPFVLFKLKMCFSFENIYSTASDGLFMVSCFYTCLGNPCLCRSTQKCILSDWIRLSDQNSV